MNIKKLTQIIDIAEGIEELDDNTKEIVSIVRNLIAEENTAAASYIEKAKKVEELGYKNISKILLDIANEELVHIGELQALLVSEGISTEEQINKGFEEFNDKSNIVA